MADETFPHIDGERERMTVDIAFYEGPVHGCVRRTVDAVAIRGIWALHRAATVSPLGAWSVTHVPTGMAAGAFLGEDDARRRFDLLARELPGWKSDGVFGTWPTEGERKILVEALSSRIDGSARDEEIALAQWQRKQLDDLRAANAHLEAQLEIERQRTERLMASRDACAQLAEDRLRMLDVATAKVADLDAATDRALALSEEVARLRAEVADLKCPDCTGSGRVWVGEDKDRPATCFACDGRGRR